MLSIMPLGDSSHFNQELKNHLNLCILLASKQLPLTRSYDMIHIQSFRDNAIAGPLLIVALLIEGLEVKLCKTVRFLVGEFIVM